MNFLLLLCAFFFANACFAIDWNASVGSDPNALTKIFYIVQSSKTGRALIESAASRDPEFKKKIHIGKFSVTESTLQRSFDLRSGDESIELNQEIFLSKNLKLSDAVLDLAHELTHFSFRNPMNPYEGVFEINRFIRHGIEGKGGELNAFMSECQVNDELQAKDKNFPKHHLCERYRLGHQRFDAEAAGKDFYRVGVRAHELISKLEIKELNTKAPIFRSAQTGTSYPEALAAEFNETQRLACNNNAKRLRLIQSHAAGNDKANRVPASLQVEVQRIKVYQKKYCGVTSYSY